MDRRAFLKTVVAGGGAALLASEADALKFYPHPSKQKWAILYGSRYGTTRDASCWISEGMGAIADVYDARENPDLSSFEAVVVGSGIYSGKIDKPLDAFLAARAAGFRNKIRALFIVCGGGDTPRAQAYVERLASACGIKPGMAKIFPGRLTIRLLDAPDNKIEEEVARKQNHPYEDYDNLKRKDCLQFGQDILARGA